MLPSFAMLHGPSSKRRPVDELQPGPPFSHKIRGAFSGLDLDSKNLKTPCSIQNKHHIACKEQSPEEQMLSTRDVQVP